VTNKIQGLAMNWNRNGSIRRKEVFDKNNDVFIKPILPEPQVWFLPAQGKGFSLSDPEQKNLSLSDFRPEVISIISVSGSHFVLFIIRVVSQESVIS
jgi:hypothetical protein